MNSSTIWSLRLGFSNKQSPQIEKMGIAKFLKLSFDAAIDSKPPECLANDPKTWQDLKAFRQKIKETTDEEQKKILKNQLTNAVELKKWWIHKIRTNEFPLREKMVCFWHNHFVATAEKVRVKYWIYQHNQILRENAFGNFKELTKEILKTNAMVRYLDNVDNKKDAINENLSRELLELFTLGIGNYTEDDIKNGAKALAGLGIGDGTAKYRKPFENKETITYLGKTGNFKADDLVDIIFEQPNISYRITKKILQWFIYDNPPENLIKYYGDYLKSMNFEIKPLLTKLFTEEFSKNNAGSKIKDPLVYILQLVDELGFPEVQDSKLIFFLKQQGMDLFNQPNVKGWDGGNSWLSSQIYLQRNNVADLLCSGKNINGNGGKKMPAVEGKTEPNENLITIDLKWNKAETNKLIISELANRLLFQIDENTQKDMESILKYDFDPTSEGANNAVLRLFNYIVKTPEYQLI